ncbi:MAG: hypothetical protein H6963_04315 [Chromatiaceae bacterium]|nr:hypothetical protein [Chromatiaceae bacterium]MCP5408506.1 hypothetical protein [Chromatiaceae bacterium]MCP5444859.1 hypothetical protein [Chromatiaceae bacterium]
MSQETVKIRLLAADALDVDVDVLALKYAQANYGLDTKVSRILTEEGKEPSLMKPKPNGFCLIDGVSGIAARQILFVGVAPLYSFGYAEIREFSRRVLSALAGSAPRTRRIALTLHGAGYGLDENEAFESEVAGLIDAIRSLDFPEDLEEVVIIEGNRGRAQRLDAVLRQLLPGGGIAINVHRGVGSGTGDSEKLRTVGYTSAAKEHVFVAMPFKDEMDDVYHYGIQGAVRGAGFLCERADLSSFTGDVMDWVRERVRSATLVIADLTEANPNVYLEVGYAWGCGVATLLLVQDVDHLKFDTRGQRCLLYKKIRDLEDSLTKELRALRDNRTI